MAAGLDGTSVIFAGFTYGSWVETLAGTGEYTDFAGMALDADGTLLWTYQVRQGWLAKSEKGCALMYHCRPNPFAWADFGAQFLRKA